MSAPKRNSYDYQARLILETLREIDGAVLEDGARTLRFMTGNTPRVISINLHTGDGSIISSANERLLELLVGEG